MSISIKANLAAVSALAISSAAFAAPVVFDNRQNVNVVNSDTVIITDSPTAGAPMEMVGNHWVDTRYFIKSVKPDPELASIDIKITFDFGVDRNVKTIRLFDGFGTPGGYSLTNGTVSTSLDGSIFTPVVGTTFTDGGGNGMDSISLPSAANTRYLRVTGTGYAGSEAGSNTPGAEKWWNINSIRVLGDTGTLAAGEHLDLVSSTGLNAGVTVSPIGGASYTNTNAATIQNDNPTTLGNTILYAIPTGGGADIVFGQNIDFDRFGFLAREASPSETFNILGSTDGGATFNATPLYSHVGGFAVGPNFFDINDFTGNALRYVVTGGDISAAHPTITDFFVFQSVAETALPEPTSAGAILLLSGLVGFARRRRGNR